jgi:hypothetical protein
VRAMFGRTPGPEPERCIPARPVVGGIDSSIRHIRAIESEGRGELQIRRFESGPAREATKTNADTSPPQSHQSRSLTGTR